MSSFNNSTNVASLPPSAAPQILYFVMIGNIVIGSCGMLGSLLVIVIIYTSKPLRTPCFELIGVGAIGSLLVASFYFGRGLDNIGELTGTMLSPYRPALTCLLTAGIQSIFGIPFHGIVTCLVGVDRTISLLAPIRYRQLGKRYVVYMLAATVVLVFIEELVGFLTAPLEKTVLCRSFPEAQNPNYVSFFGGFNIFCNTLNVVVYSVMLISFRRRRLALKEGSQEQRVFFKQQSSAMPTCRSLIFFYFIFGIVPDTMINVALKLDRSIYPWADIARNIGSFLKSASSLVEITSLLLFSKTFRECARKRLCIEGNQVISVVVSGSIQSRRGTS